MAKTRFFRVAVEGATTDGRHIERAWIEQAARNYSTEKYAANINLEHIKGILPGGTQPGGVAGSPFGNYGSVVALKAEAISGGPLNGKMALYAQVDPTAELVALNKQSQKLYPSCEINPNFATSGEAYLVGLAVTDDPASLGTERFEFSAKSTANTFAKRKQAADNVLTATSEDMGFSLELEPEQEPTPAEGVAAFTAALKEAFSFLKPAAPATPAATSVPASPAPVDQSAAVAAVLEKFSVGLDKVMTAQATEIAGVKTQLADLTAKFANTPAPGQGRDPATGGNGTVATDC